MFRRKGQSTMEYAVIIAVVVGGLLAMQYYVKRGYQGKLKSAADDMGEQFDPGKYSATFKNEQHSKVTQEVQNRVTTTTNIGDQTSNRTLIGQEVQSAWEKGEDVYGNKTAQ